VDLFHGLFSSRINPEIDYFGNFAKKPLSFFEITRNPKIIPKRSLASEKSTKIAPKLQNSISFKPQLQI
jgi:hypothetical protein